MSNPSSAFSAVLCTLLLLLNAHRAGGQQQQQEYALHPDSKPQDGVPAGTVTKHQFANSKVFPGTVRDYSVYVPAQYKKDEPACLMVFQDGGGGLKVKETFDNLIAKKEMPVTIAVMVTPGVIPAKDPAAAHPRYNRSYEYDSPTDLYARFLIDELIPEVAKEYNLTKDATGRAICGSSSGAIAAFVAAWERPDYFSRVVSFIGSYTNLRGGNDLPSLIRKTEPKAIRVYLQAGRNDLDIYSGSWFIGNQDVASALAYAGYEHHLEVGHEGHNGKHAAAIFPDALRYVWKGYPELPKVGTFAGKDKRNVMDVLIPGEGWQVVSQGHRNAEGPTSDAQGTVYFSDGPANRIFRVTPGGNASLFLEDPAGCDGMMVGPNNRLFVCAPKTRQIIAYDLSDPKNKTVVADDMPSVNDLVVTHKGAVYATDHKNKQVWYIPPDGYGKEKKVVDTGLQFPNGVILTPDQTQLIVADMNGPGLYLFTIKDDGTLANKAPYYYAQIPPHRSTSGADGLAMDTRGNLFAATHMGLQIFDQAGRVTAIIPGPTPGGRRPSNVDFGGVDFEYLYIAQGDKVYRRKTQSKGVLFFQPPVLPPKPRL